MLSQIKLVYLCLSLFSIITMGKGDLGIFFKTEKNLTKITWAHAVNNNTLLMATLKSDKNMLEADVQLGNLTTDPTKSNIPVMAHPPNKKSDLSLEQFLTNVSDFNLNNKKSPKGIKLDFKSIEAFNASIPILQVYKEKINFPLILNADIVKGPGDPTASIVNPEEFLTQCKNFQNSILSIGWTTNFNGDTINQTYTQTHIESMLNIIDKFNITQEITFPVRAVYAANSLKQMSVLIKNVSDSTLTIWSGEDDDVNATKLQEIISSIGLNKIYIDVPNNLTAQLNLSGSAVTASKFGMFSLILTIIFYVTLF